MAEPAGFSVWADWRDVHGPVRIGDAHLSRQQGRRTVGFAFSDDWLRRQDHRQLDPDLNTFRGPQYPKDGRSTFGFLTDSAPDRWGRLLMQRREALDAASEGRTPPET